MGALMTDIPPEIARHGIKKVTDNRNGRVVVVPAGQVVALFGDELMRRLAAKRGNHGTKQAGS